MLIKSPQPHARKPNSAPQSSCLLKAMWCELELFGTLNWWAIRTAPRRLLPRWSIAQRTGLRNPPPLG
ncbi:unnamed protein product, partial [Iphiclides podalirius]